MPDQQYRLNFLTYMMMCLHELVHGQPGVPALASAPGQQEAGLPALAQHWAGLPEAEVAGSRLLPPLLTILSEVSLSLFMRQCLTALTVSLVVFETDTALVTVAATRLTHMSPEHHYSITSTLTKATTMLTRAHPSSPWTQPSLIS